MVRIALFALALACPAAFAQSTDAEARALADAFTATDLETLGECQGRVEGMDLVAAEFSGWLVAEGHTSELAGIRDAQAKGADLIARISERRTDAAKAAGLSLAASEAARARMLGTFVRRDGEDNYAAYNRWRPETRLPKDCNDAMKRAAWKAELDGGDS